MADNLPGLDDLLKSIRDDDKSSSSSALAVVPKKPEDLVEEDIDSQILSILGLEDVFDLTYEEYASLLKEASVKGRMPHSQMSTESVELVTEEFKRVKGKTGKFKVKPKKVDINKVMNRRAPTPSGAIVKPQKLIPPGVDTAEEVKPKVDVENLQNDMLNGIGNILESLITIRTILGSQNKVEEKSVEKSRKETEKKKKKEREATLEKKKPSFKLPKMLSKPVDDFFGAIKRFFTNVLLGSVVLAAFKWFKDPGNQGAIEGFSNFLQKNAPLILGGLLAIAALPIASTLLGLTGSVLGGIGIITKALGGLGGLLLKIPGLGGALGAAAPVAGTILASGAAAVGVALAMKGTYDLIRGQIAGGGDFAKVDEQLRNKLAGYGITETGMTYKKGSRKQQKLSASQQKVYEEIQGKRDQLRKLKEERDAKIREIELNKKYYTQKSPRSARVLSNEGERKIQEIRQSYNQKALQIFGTEQPAVQPQTSATTDYVSPFAGAREKEALKASKITGNAPITVGEKAGYSASRGRIHAGRDIAAPSGTGLQVPSDSVITDKGVDSGYGNYIVFKDANGIEHLYGHMIEPSPYSKGDNVSAGTVIGRVGSTGSSTGPHLHWEVSRVMGEVGRPRSTVIDPLEIGFPTQAPFTGKVEAAQIAQTKPATPSIPSPTGMGNIVPLPLTLGGTQQQAQSNSAPLQPPVPRFSSEDPNNMTTMVVRSIYNVVG